MGEDGRRAVQEARLVDEPVPALGATTSRPATVDPIGYHELEPLLAALTNPHHRGSDFDPDRLHKLLDLP